MKSGILAIVIFASIILLSGSRTTLSAQENSQMNKEGYAMVTRVHYGFLLAHHDRVQHLVRHTSGFEVSLSKQTDGRKLWQQYFLYPQTGYSYIFLDFNRPSILGNAHALLAFINIPFERSDFFQFSFRMAAGLGYLTKKFDRVENYKNDVIGSHLNAAIQFNFETRYRLSQTLFFNFNIGLTHFSNGSFQTPNLGINNPSANAGFTCQFRPIKEFIKSEFNPPDKQLQLDVLYAFGMKEISPPTGKKYGANTLSATALKAVGHKVRLGAGLDFFYDLSLIEGMRRLDRPLTANTEIIRSGIHVDDELMFDKLSILFQMGGYWLDQYKVDGIFYHRVGFKYLLNHHLFINLTLKTHFAKADYVETGLGWKFGKDLDLWKQ